MCLCRRGLPYSRVPEQIFCGNRLQVTHHSLLQDLPVPLHSFFHVTSSIGKARWGKKGGRGSRVKNSLSFTVERHSADLCSDCANWSSRWFP